MPHPTPPTPPTASDDIRILRAWMDAELQHPGDARAVLALVESAVAECRARRQGRGRISDVYEQVPAWMRPYFGLPWGEGLKRLLGRWGKDSGFIPGEVAERYQLTEDEATVYWWELRGWQEWEIQRELTAKGLRMDRSRWVEAERVTGLLESAHGKVRGLFAIDGP